MNYIYFPLKADDMLPQEQELIKRDTERECHVGVTNLAQSAFSQMIFF